LDSHRIDNAQLQQLSADSGGQMLKKGRYSSADDSTKAVEEAELARQNKLMEDKKLSS